MKHKILLTVLIAIGFSLSGASHALSVLEPNGTRSEAKVEGNKLMLEKSKRWVPAGDGTYKTNDGKTLIVQGGIIMAQSGSSSPPKAAPLPGVAQPPMQSLPRLNSPPPIAGIAPPSPPIAAMPGMKTAQGVGIAPAAPVPGAAPPPAIGLKPLTAPAPMQSPSMTAMAKTKPAMPSPATTPSTSPSMTAPVLQGGIAGATSSGRAQPAINIPKATQLTQLSPSVTRQIMLSRTERFTELKREVERKRAKAEADAARVKTENEKTRGAAALNARRGVERAAAAAARNLEQFCAGGGDADGDGHVSSACSGDDCDDTDAARYPGATEICDLYGHDEDCDATTFGTQDVDGDGHMSSACFNTDARGSVRAGQDCDDSRADAHPGAAETCDLLDNNCEGRIDEGQTLPYYVDADSDGHGSRATRMNVCPSEVTAAADQRDAGGTGLPWVTSSDDCDDSNPGIWNAVSGCQ